MPLHALTIRTMQDDGGTARGGSDRSRTHVIEIRVMPVNNAPSFKSIANEALLCSDLRHFNRQVAVNMSAGPSEQLQNLSFRVHLITGGTDLFEQTPVVSQNGTMSFISTATRSVNARVAVLNITLVDDGGAEDGGRNHSTPSTFTLTIEPYLEHNLSTLVYIMDEDTAPAAIQLLVCILHRAKRALPAWAARVGILLT